MKAKPSGIKYTELCMYIDKVNYYRDENNNPTGLRDLTEEEIENVYTYLYHIIYALAVKKRMLRKKEDYDSFCIEAAGDIYMRLRSVNQVYSAGPAGNKAIKSILNYIKGSLPFMCITWRRKNFCQIVGPGTYHDADDAVDAKTYVREQANNQSAFKKRETYNDVITGIPKYFKQAVDRSILRKDPLASYELLLSMYLSLLNASSLTNKQLSSYVPQKSTMKILNQLNNKSEFIINFSANPLINKDFVDITLKKALQAMGEYYKESLNYIEPTEEDLNNILTAARTDVSAAFSEETC